MFIRRAPSWSAMVSVVVGLIGSAVGFYSEWLFERAWYFQEVVFVNVAASALAFMATMPWWSKAGAAYRGQVDAFFERMHRPVVFEQEVGVGNDRRQLRVMGRFAVVIGLFVIGLVLLPNDLVGRLGILFVGGFVALVGGLMWWTGRDGASDVVPEPAGWPAAES